MRCSDGCYNDRCVPDPREPVFIDNGPGCFRTIVLPASMPNVTREFSEVVMRDVDQLHERARAEERASLDAIVDSIRGSLRRPVVWPILTSPL